VTIGKSTTIAAGTTLTKSTGEKELVLIKVMHDSKANWQKPLMSKYIVINIVHKFLKVKSTIIEHTVLVGFIFGIKNNL
jgi:hypothetical protein